MLWERSDFGQGLAGSSGEALQQSLQSKHTDLVGGATRLEGAQLAFPQHRAPTRLEGALLAFPQYRGHCYLSETKQDSHRTGSSCLYLILLFHPSFLSQKHYLGLES